MKKDFQTLLDTFQENNFPVMMEYLAGDLGVSADSLSRLGIGFAPIVEFKKGPNFGGWWVIAERDPEGEPVGLSLRNDDGFKCMYPGSNHGLIYEVAEGHTRGEKGFNPGPSNWIRTMDSGVVCPVCGKPDGCLLSSENPQDPKAVVCIRVKVGARRPMKMGYLHIRKAEGEIKSCSALANNGGPVIAVEGMSDTATAMDLGFNAVGRPSDKACMQMVCEILRGRSVIIVGENDRKADGREPGKEGMQEAFQMIRRVSGDVQMVMPPTHIKDLRAWKTKYGLNREEFLAYIAENGTRAITNDMIEDDRPLTAARAYLRDTFMMGKRSLLRRWRREWYVYRGSKYEVVPEEEYQQPIHGWSYEKKISTEDAKGNITMKPVKADNAFISNLTAAVVSEVLVTAKDLPCWINEYQGPDCRNLIVFSNGIMDATRYADGDDGLMELTPDLFSTAALPVSYDPTAKCPIWLAFIESSLGDDHGKIRLLQEWMGYCMTMNMQYHKMMFLRGVKRSGKGTIIRAMIAMLGEEQSAITDFVALAKDFGLAPLAGKLGCFIPDARLTTGADATHGLGVLLNITGGDAVQINKKNVNQVAHHHLICKITVAANEFPNFSDDTGAMESRLNIIDFQRSFYGREDFGLDNKLKAEIAGIAIWALAGLRRLREQGRFTVPESSIKAISDFKLNASPVASFLSECTEEGGNIRKSEVEAVWDGWIKRTGVKDRSRQRLIEQIRMNAPQMAEDTTGPVPLLVGLHWKAHVPKAFLGRPT